MKPSIVNQFGHRVPKSIQECHSHPAIQSLVVVKVADGQYYYDLTLVEGWQLVDTGAVQFQAQGLQQLRERLMYLDRV